MRFAYADPPYPGTARRYPEKQEVDHGALVEHLRTFDGWVLHTNPQNARAIAGLCPEARMLAWLKRDALPVAKAGLLYSWEPVFLVPLRRTQHWVRDSVASDSVTIGPPSGRFETYRGAKPAVVCRWIFLAAGLETADELTDLFPGSGAVTRAWNHFRTQGSLPFVEVPA